MAGVPIHNQEPWLICDPAEDQLDHGALPRVIDTGHGSLWHTAELVVAPPLQLGAEIDVDQDLVLVFPAK